MILNDFSFINKCIEQRTSELDKLKKEKLDELEMLHASLSQQITDDGNIS